MKKKMLALCALATVLAFLVASASPAGAAKPARWKAAVTGVNLVGLADFIGGQDNVNINSGTATDSATGELYGYIELRVYNPSLRFFLDANAFSGSPDDHPSFGFPSHHGTLAVEHREFPERVRSSDR